MDLNELYNYKIEATSLINKSILDLFLDSKNIYLLTNDLYYKLCNTQNAVQKKELFNLIFTEAKKWKIDLDSSYNDLDYHNYLFKQYIENKYYPNDYQSVINYKINNNYENVNVNTAKDQYTKPYRSHIQFYEKSLYKRNIDMHDGNALSNKDSLENLKYKNYN